MTLNALTPAEWLPARQYVALAAPVLLIASMLWVFRACHRRFGYPLGYLLAFGVYWLGWCLALPTALLGGFEPLAGLFWPFPPLAALGWRTQLLLWWPIIFPFAFVFWPRLGRSSLRLLSVSTLLGLIIGVTEEIFWRGLYLRLFPGSVWLNLAYPTLMFALWHLAPLSVRPNRLPGGALAFVAYAAALGTTYALAATLTGSIAWATIAHAIHDSLGLGAQAYGAWLGQPQGGALPQEAPSD